MNLKGRVALITGASSGIGWQTALAFAEKGARLAVTARSADKLHELADLIRKKGGECFVAPADVTDADSVRQAAELVGNHYARIDILVNNAGFGVFKPVLEMDMQTVEEMMNVNYFGMVRFIQAVVPIMIRQNFGHVVNVASLAGFMAAPTHGAYAATKFAVIGLSEALREEVRPQGILVSTVNPGPIDTPFFERADLNHIPPIARRFMLKPDKVAQSIVRAIEQEIPQVVIPGGMVPVIKIKALMPNLFARGTGKLYRRKP
ncbi:SDR family NAD(P)-dependent oxidoreductase [Effusibacillus dendaii]|uniref:Oxidoreductase n=1 Tax=Effusibacillus dendaii TaxID=2743772 RepID=A0A7I8D5D3_9BACL|nr:SDR family oxidoreductase [Effusibacillus dendaii]BCJ85338.1 oxidoreductase [Effusibacillus dendaii]